MSRPTATECKTWRERYEEADLALHKLRTGSKAESMRMGEKQVTFTPARLADLVSYVSYLKSKVDECDGVVASPRRRAIAITPAN